MSRCMCGSTNPFRTIKTTRKRYNVQTNCAQKENAGKCCIGHEKSAPCIENRRKRKKKSLSISHTARPLLLPATVVINWSVHVGALLVWSRAPRVSWPSAHGWLFGCPAASYASLDTAEAAARDGQQEECSKNAAHGDGNILVVLEPVLDLLPRRSALAATILTSAAAAAGCTIEEVLISLRTEAIARCLTRQETAVGASLHTGGCRILIVCSALLISRCALTRCALEAITTVCAIVAVFVLGACRAASRALLLGITRACARSTDST